MPMISPASSIIPVNIYGDHQVGSARCRRQIAELERVDRPLDAVSTDDRDFAPAEDPRGHKGHYFINDTGFERGKRQVRTALQHEALDLASIQVIHQSRQAGTKDQEVGRLIDSQPAVEYHSKKGPAPGFAGPVGEPRVVAHKRSATGNNRVYAMSEFLYRSPRFLRR